MSDRFDDDIKRALESFEESYDDNSWDRLSAYMDEHPEVLSDQLDDALEDKLSRHSVPVDDRDWTTLKTELDIIDEKKERLWLLKGLEVCILALLFFTVDNLTRYTSDTIEYAQKNTMGVEQLPILGDASLASSIEVQPADVILLSENDISEDHSTLVVNESDLLLESLPAEVSNNLPAEGVLMMAALVMDDISETEQVNAHTRQTETLSRLEAYISPISITQDVELTVTYAVMEDIQDDKRVKYSFELPFSRDINAINSSIVSSPFGRRFSQGDMGHSFGGLVSFYPAPKVSLSSGIIYSNKTHALGRLKSVTKASAGAYLETELDHIDFQEVSVPVILRYSESPYDQSGFYASVGAGFHFITDYEYETRKIIQPSSRVTSFDVNGGIDLSSLPVGLMSQGPVDDNVYITGVIGVGYQMVLPHSAALFLQPQYQFTLGKGANDYIRRVNSFNLEAGVRFMFVR